MSPLSIHRLLTGWGRTRAFDPIIPRLLRTFLHCLIFLSFTSAPLASLAQAPDPDPESEAAYDTSDREIELLGRALLPLEFEWGRGVHVGETGLNIGGFSTVELEREEGEDGELALDSINLLILFQPIEQLRGFTEIEIGDLFAVDFADGTTESAPDAHFERLYGDVALNDALGLRVGKFQTPVGIRNQVPAEPFVWTAQEPVQLESFQEHQTGGALFGSLFPGSRELSYKVYGQFVDGFDEDPDERGNDLSVGTRLEYGDSRGLWTLGTSFLASDRNDDWSYLIGADARFRWGIAEFISEFLVVEGDAGTRPSGTRDALGIYFEAVFEVIPTFYLVGRYEYFDPRNSDPTLNVGDVGVVWRPKPFIDLKATYRFSDHEPEEDPRGLKASFAVLF